MKKLSLVLLPLLASAAISGCMSTKLILDDKWNPSLKPSYVDYFDSYWFGLSGEPSVSLQKVCMDQKPLAVQRIKTAEDGFITVVTLGIYTPTTVKIWCGE